ncbi:tetratricopeptide repeat protein [Phormidium sp. CLA17]|uniref:tetratricopeptide repeat protein n=1 Tax=Leptolyngbya sp. Cla-17 TaxID=2803751 RepID=UPI00193273F5|nr:tetratricopeptide repeat protein [Leptolyngbya sp. Cla-17]MBM0740197.1 tetratricopeptide repeat protein [Leptolyngbya sp. Cla-17]
MFSFTRVNGNSLGELIQWNECGEFIPGHLRLAQTLEASDRRQEAISILQQALTQNPAQPDLCGKKPRCWSFGASGRQGVHQCRCDRQC